MMLQVSQLHNMQQGRPQKDTKTLNKQENYLEINKKHTTVAPLIGTGPRRPNARRNK